MDQLQDLTPHRHHAFFFPSRFARTGGTAPRRSSPWCASPPTPPAPASSAARRLPLVVRPVRRLPALWLLPGHTPAQLARWPAVGNCAMSAPISATITSAARRPTPGIVTSRRRRLGEGAHHPAIRIEYRSISASSCPSCSISVSSRKRWCSVTRPKRPPQRDDLLLQAPPRLGGQGLRVPLAGDDPTDHRPARGAEDVGGDAGQLDVGPLQHLLDAVGHRRLLGDELGPLPRQVAQLADRLRRHEAPGQEPVGQQLGDPLGVLDVGLAPRDLPHVAGVDQRQVEPPLQQVPDRLPVDAGRLHRGVGDPLGGEPVGQLQESAVMVGKVRDRTWTRPSASTRRTQATTVFLCTSSPAQRSSRTSIGGPPGWMRPRGATPGQAEQFALRAPRHAGGDRVGSDVESGRGRAMFVRGLDAPVPNTASAPGAATGS